MPELIDCISSILDSYVHVPCTFVCAYNESTHPMWPVGAWQCAGNVILNAIMCRYRVQMGLNMSRYTTVRQHSSGAAVLHSLWQETRGPSLHWRVCKDLLKIESAAVFGQSQALWVSVSHVGHTWA